MIRQTASLIEQGKVVYEKNGCVACHDTQKGEIKIGPSHKGLFGSRVLLADGKTVLADENFIRKAIEEPGLKLVKGFNPVMPTFKGLINDKEMNALIAYIKSLK